MVFPNFVIYINIKGLGTWGLGGFISTGPSPSDCEIVDENTVILPLALPNVNKFCHIGF